MTYEQYMGSATWARLRSEALVRDGFRCRGCDTTEGLEVHHRRYGDPLGTETVDDLTTLCGGPEGCHHAITETIRRRRYRDQQHVIVPAARVTPGKSERHDVHRLQAIDLPPHRRVRLDLP